MDFTTKNTKTSTPELTKTQGTIIFNKIIELGNSDLAFKAIDTDFEYSHMKIIDKEIDRLFSEIDKLMSGSYLITPAETKYDDETGELLTNTPAVYYQATTKTDLKTMFSSDYISDTDVLRAYVGYKGFNYDSEFDKFIASYEGSN